jgi:hypothetical protein
MSGDLATTPAGPIGPLGRQLWELLPEIYRRSDNGDLAAWLDGMGHLLELFRNTLDQRLADCFPDRPLEGKACQDWLLPYFAELFDARLVSPDPDGQRAEVAQVIGWRKSKGTLAVVEQVAQEVGRLEVEVQEGWRRVATTPRIDLTALGPSASRGMVAFDRRSRALRTGASDPAGRATRFGDQLVHWRQGSPEGIPCFPGSYEDVSARTPDLRNPNWRQGHAHPRRLLLFYPPPAGFFAPSSPRVAWTDLEAAIHNLDNQIFRLEATGGDLLFFEEQGMSWKIERLRESGQVLAIRLSADGLLKTERTWTANGAPRTRVYLAGRQFFREDGNDGTQIFRAERGELVITDPLVLFNGATACELTNLSFIGEVRLLAFRNQLQTVAVRDLKINAPLGLQLSCTDCLIETLNAPGNRIRLEHTTVLKPMAVPSLLQASDSILAGTFTSQLQGTAHCLRYSRVPPGLSLFSEASPFHNTEALPLFMALDFVDEEKPVRRPARFGEPGCGVLHPGAPRAIRFGSEDGGEMGAYHARRYSLAEEAVRQKLSEFLPVGLEAVLIPDSRLLSPPPTLKKAET